MQFDMFILLLWIVNGFTAQGSIFDRNPAQLHRHCLNSRLVCSTYPGLTFDQMAFCRKHPALTFAAMLGVRWSLQECGYQFREERWNCSNLLTAALRDGFPFKHKFLKRGYRESATALAFLSAGILTEISKSCMSGELPFCEAKELNNIIMNNRTNYGHNYVAINGTKIYSRSHNISLYYADRMTKLFLKSKVKPRDPYWHVRHHNLNVGREIVKDNYREQCHCRGFPGTCEVKTCWFVVAPFREIAQKIKQKHDLAVMINAKSLKATRQKICRDKQTSSPSDKRPSFPRYRHFRPRSHFRLATRQRNTNKHTNNTLCRKSHHYHLKATLPKNQLIYTEDSPDYCQPSPHLGLAGTQGRICNATTNNCKRLCCDRGFETEFRTKKVRCRCKFKWCCDVICETCYVRRRLGVCH